MKLAPLVLLALAVLLGGLWYWRQRQALAPAAGLEASLSLVEGSVKLFKGEKELPIQAGLRLDPDMELRTGPDSRAQIRLTDGSSMTVGPHSAFRVQELTSLLSRFRLITGRATADIIENTGRTVEVEAQGSDARARTTGGLFTITSNSKGVVALATQRGIVRFSAAGKEVLIQRNEQSIVLPGQAPSTPAPIPQEVFLNVQWPAAGLTNQPTLTLSGRTDTGATVSVNETAATVDASGRFIAEFPLKQGKNQVIVLTRDAAGNLKRSASPPIIYDPQAPKTKVQTSPELWR